VKGSRAAAGTPRSGMIGRAVNGAIASLLVLGACSAGCVARERLNSDCEWNDLVSPRITQHAAGQRHLIEDVTVAEEIAIRYADVRKGRRSGHFEGSTAYVAARQACMATLIAKIAVDHHVSEPHVRDQIGRRESAVDAAIGLTFAAIYTFIAGWIVGAFQLGKWTPMSLAAVLMASAAISAAGILSGELWSGLAETIRLGTTHMSYRAERLPWRHHRAELFLAGTLIFWLLAWRSQRKSSNASAQSAISQP
jgi:hypothetical protein